MEFGFFSIIPSVVTITLAIYTRKVVFSLFIGIFLGVFILYKFNPFLTYLGILDLCVSVFKEPSNTSTILFTVLIGGLIALLRDGGGVQGFVDWVDRRLSLRGGKKIYFYTFLTGMFLFIETNISILATTTIFRPLFEKFKLAKEKLALLADTTAAPICILIPFNAWGAFIISILISTGLSENTFIDLLSSIKYNFYPISILAITLISTIIGWDFKTMKNAYKNNIENQEDNLINVKNKYSHFSMTVVTLLTLILSTILFLSYTSYDLYPYEKADMELIDYIKYASGSSAVLYSITLSICVAMSMILIKKRGSIIKKSLSSGFKNMITPATIMFLAFGIGMICKELKTGIYVSRFLSESISKEYLLWVIFIISCLISFSTGTSWGTFAIMIPIALPLTLDTPFSIPMLLGAVLGGGIFGDHCSPLSDTSILSSIGSGCTHINHVRTQLPYAIFSAVITSLVYLIIGFNI